LPLPVPGKPRLSSPLIRNCFRCPGQPPRRPGSANSVLLPPALLL